MSGARYNVEIAGSNGKSGACGDLHIPNSRTGARKSHPRDANLDCQLSRDKESNSDVSGVQMLREADTENQLPHNLEEAGG